jgi:cysteine desulfuration protein SufE
MGAGMRPDTIADRAGRIVAEFAPLTDPIDRYRRLIELGDAASELPAADRTEETRLPGCQYAVWLGVTHDPEANRLHFRVGTDARIVRGLAALIVGAVDGQSPADVAAADFGFLDTIGVRSQLGVHRGNGLASLIDEVRRHARACLDDPAAA